LRDDEVGVGWQIRPASAGILLARRATVAMFVFIRRLLSAFYLISHSAVPLRLKLLPLLAFAYLVFPRDLFPDYIRGLGIIDDVIVITVLFGIFTTRALKHVRGGQRRKKDSIDVDFEVLGRVDPNADSGAAPVEDRAPTDDIRNS
jgi:uncharacterized membrane protein YkvA (DUF1232 family)